MIVKFHAKGRAYVIAAPAGSRVRRRGDSSGPAGESAPDVLIVPWRGREVAVPEEPPELLPILAEAGRLGLRLLAIVETAPLSSGE